MRASAPQRGYDGRVAALVGVLQRAGVACELQLGRDPKDVMLVGSTKLGVGPQQDRARYRLVLRNNRVLRGPITQYTLGRAYVQGDVDIVISGRGSVGVRDAMSVFSVRDASRHGTPLAHAARLVAEVALVPPAWANARAIRRDYRLDDAFFHTFLDRRYQFYSQGLFGGRRKSLEQAAEDKLGRMWKDLGLKPGDRILDIGGGWGGLAEYGLSKGVHVTSLTLTEDSKRYIEKRIAPLVTRAGGPDGEVIVEDLIQHRRRERYDHAVIFGVIEHIPTYGRFVRRVWDALKPGGRLYLDASATREKYVASPFTRQYIWRGPHSCLALQDMIEELVFHGFKIVRAGDETKDYELTMTGWAKRLDANHAKIAARWGEHTYRTFRVFLWGGAEAFGSDRLQAYSLVAERRRDPGPRPGRLRRAGHFVASMR